MNNEIEGIKIDFLPTVLFYKGNEKPNYSVLPYNQTMDKEYIVKFLKE